MSCVAIEETLAEKVLSFLRRHAEHRAGFRKDWDETLVRHIYDTFCIVTSDPLATERATNQFSSLVAFDVAEFKKHPEFSSNPMKCMTEALYLAETEIQTRIEFQSKLQPLIYGSVRPDFEEAFKIFKATAQQLLASLRSD